MLSWEQLHQTGRKLEPTAYIYPILYTTYTIYSIPCTLQLSSVLGSSGLLDISSRPPLSEELQPPGLVSYWPLFGSGGVLWVSTWYICMVYIYIYTHVYLYKMVCIGVQMLGPL